MNISEETMKEITGYPFEQLYDVFLATTLDEMKTIKHVSIVKHGKDVPFDIRYYLNDLYTLKPKNKKVLIDNLVVNIKDFWDEIEYRKAIMQRVLMDIASDDEIIEAR